jgi:hypothetical protein
MSEVDDGEIVINFCPEEQGYVNQLCFVSAAAHSRASGRMVNATGWAWRRVAGGCIGVSGRKVSRVGTACGSPPRRTRGTKARGPMGCRMAMALRRTLTEVSVYMLVSIVTSQQG